MVVVPLSGRSGRVAGVSLERFITSLGQLKHHELDQRMALISYELL